MSYIFSTGNTKRLAFSLLYMTQPQQAVQYSQCLGSIKKSEFNKKTQEKQKARDTESYNQWAKTQIPAQLTPVQLKYHR